MKKIFSKKTLSAFLAAIMVLAMIPMGMISAVAETRTLPTVPDGATVIDSAAKWNELAGTITSGNVVLTADIDFSDVTPKTLFAEFSGVFYGNGKTIKNATIEATALIATALKGGTIQDVTIDNCVLETTEGSSAIIAGASSTSATTISYCTVSDCTVTAGAQSGIILGAANKSTTISNCTVTGTTTITGMGANAAIVGKVNNGCYTLKITDCTIGENVTVASEDCSNDYACGLGLVIGNAGTSAAGVQTSVTVTGCEAYGKINYTGSSTPYVGGLIGSYYCNGNNNAKLNISGNAVSGTIVVGTTTTATNAIAGGVIGYFNTSITGNVIAENTVSTNIISHNRVGGVIGEFASTTGCLDISKCIFTGSLSVPNAVNGNTSMGGILGYFATASSTSNINITRCEITETATISNKANYDGARGTGGIVGRLGDGTNDMNFTMNISDCLVRGSISRMYNSSYKINTAGVIGNLNSKSATVNVSNVIISANINGGTASSLGTNGSIICTKTAGTLNVKSCAATMGEESGVSKINSDNLDKFYAKDSNGYIVGVMGSLVGTMMAQVSNVVDDAYIIRFVMPAMVDTMTDVTMTVKVKNGDAEVHTYEIPCTMWDKLTGYDGRTGFTEYTPATYGAKKLLAGAILNVPTGTAYSFEISTTFTVSGVEITSTTYGASVTTAGALVTE